MPPRKLILASTSPQRKRLMAEAGYSFDVVVPEGNEPDPNPFSDAGAYASYTAWFKARQVADRVPDGIVVAADTVVAIAGQIIGKPADRDHARRILEALSGSPHQCLTGVCIWDVAGRYWIGGLDVTDLCMRSLSKVELEEYLASNRWVGKAGAYGIQDPDPYVTILEGSHSNVVGLPLELVGKLLLSLDAAPGT